MTWPRRSAGARRPAVARPPKNRAPTATPPCHAPGQEQGHPGLGEGGDDQCERGQEQAQAGAARPGGCSNRDNVT